MQNQASKEYQVSAILDRKACANDRFEYLVHWTGYQKHESTWQPLNNLIGDPGVEKMIDEFNKKAENKNSKKWTNGLTKWVKNDGQKDSRSSKEKQLSINEKKLDTTFYEDPVPICIDGDDLLKTEKVKKKLTTLQSDRYPFQPKEQSLRHPYLGRKIDEIKQIQTKDGQDICLVRFKGPAKGEAWVPRDVLRLMCPEKLLQSYQAMQTAVLLKH